MSSGAYAVDVPKGYRVGPWVVHEPLASGAFGSVYEARRTAPADELPRTAALKFLPTGLRTPRQLSHLRELAEREAELLRRLRGPRLIRLYETLTVDDPEHPELDGATVLVLEKAEGSLAGLLDAPVPPPNGPALLTDVCAGLEQLHRSGWVHGDLKPANVLLMKDGSARLADFNMAAELEGTHAYSPAFSTPDYTPPELLWSEIGERGRQIRETGDIWAFGVLAHQVLTGTFPLPGGTAPVRRDAAVRYARGDDELRLSPELPPEWREIITDCLARTHAVRAAHDTGTLLRRVERAAGVTPSRRFHRRPGVRRPGRPVVIGTLAAVAAAALGVGLAEALREDRITYGYHRCPKLSVCFFSEKYGNGEMCAWEGDDRDWLAGGRTCPWTRTTKVQSIFNNGDANSPAHDVAYYVGRDWRFRWKDLYRDEHDPVGCTSVGQQGNLTGTYVVLSHRWVEECGADPLKS
ncbi:protein kinase [Streptomyces sp. NPDC086554]|uniref:protein kinase domain-containing protein n=1 Tax=Streptomyces sp. NPDC086554 TaxID=3154864 RepID=UPI0034161147